MMVLRARKVSEAFEKQALGHLPLFTVSLRCLFPSFVWNLRYTNYYYYYYYYYYNYYNYYYYYYYLFSAFDHSGISLLSKNKIDISFLCVCPSLVEDKFRHNIVKVYCGKTTRTQHRKQIEVQRTNVLSATVNQLFCDSSQLLTDVERAVMKSLSTIRTTKQCSAVVGS